MNSLELGPSFHTGFVVPDLGQAMEMWARLGVAWAEPIQSTSWWRSGEELRQVSMGVVYSRSSGNDPLIELVAPAEPSFFGPASQAPIHHVGYFVDDVAATAARLGDAGWPIVLSRHVDADETVPALTYHRMPGTTLHVELVPAAMRPVIEQWTATGVFPRGDVTTVDVE
jgi:hypothetical protein